MFWCFRLGKVNELGEESLEEICDFFVDGVREERKIVINVLL